MLSCAIYVTLWYSPGPPVRTSFLPCGRQSHYSDRYVGGGGWSDKCCTSRLICSIFLWVHQYPIGSFPCLCSFLLLHDGIDVQSGAASSLSCLYAVQYAIITAIDYIKPLCVGRWWSDKGCTISFTCLNLSTPFPVSYLYPSTVSKFRALFSVILPVFQ